MAGGLCWYCYWGWAKPVADIYLEAVKRLNGYERPLHFGPSHIVWEDENWEDVNIKYCLDQLTKAAVTKEDEDDFSDEELQIVKWSLDALLEIPEDVRCCAPEAYDDDADHPENYPPTCEVVKV